ncbi:hypothetical protein [Ignatzschineria cameli]|uniref:YbbD head domain-containing protein n=1 Tax=Ignatzschineria cameli TaxID=2182793 RepID=A0A2U2ASP6_9GAMM|nr:hypothetical protein [Ignatzschineria cameli]PWD86030.1 hypothetical protein DC080_04545 [Ignatzschineria cameli]PWD87758.1 hypothetical protein DC077_00275 [Ignatzschineria cameli]
MKTGKNKNILIALLLTVFVIGLIVFISILGGFHDTKTIKFPTQYQATEYIEKGWIPRDIPENATNILLSYDLDTNVINGSFQSTQEDIRKFKENLVESEKEEFIHKTRILNPDFQNIVESFLSREISFYKNDRYFFVIEDHTIYFFSLHP